MPSATRMALGIAIVTTAHATAPAARAQLADGLKACSLMTQQEIIAMIREMEKEGSITLQQSEYVV